MFLPLLIIIPFIGGILAWQSEKINKRFPFIISLITMFVFLIISTKILLIFLKTYNYKNEYPYWFIEYNHSWIPRFGINLHFGLDIISLIMILLTNILSIISVIVSRHDKIKKVGFFYFNLMLIISSVIGIFISVDLFAFFLFWEIFLIPIYFMLIIWGESGLKKHNKINVANKFFVYAQFSSFLILISIICLVCQYYNINNVLTFDYNKLIETNFNIYLEFFITLILFFAFIIKMPIVPLHTWLKDFFYCSPKSGCIDIIGLLSKTSVYGLIRFNICFFSHHYLLIYYLAIFLGMMSIIYGSLLACSQKNIKHIIAYSSVSHMGLILIALYSNNSISYYGLILQIISSSISTSALCILSGYIFNITKSRNILKINSLSSHVKYLPIFFMFFVLSNLNFPGTSNFISELLILFGLFKSHYYVVIMIATTLIITSIYSLSMFHNIFYFGSHSKIVKHHDNKIKISQYIILFVLSLISLYIGFFPQNILDISFSFIKILHNKLFF
ncbi:NADH-quinone oxidoreductase subunit M [Buchnera aphidicola (Taiwanaphis decaspermi)]|uniref:complex I subunit 4 family protein n=1 Tax=Buchnera aphidicola TaxID=9 RepID=UPI0031B8A6E2